jgi:iron complex outermembrane receptor protein
LNLFDASRVLGVLLILPSLGSSGSGIDRNAVQNHVLNASDLRREGTPDLVRSLGQQVSGAALDSASDNPFPPTFFYHGFAAPPLQGTPQGLAVYVNGVRFSQPFGDTVVRT